MHPHQGNPVSTLAELSGSGVQSLVHTVFPLLTKRGCRVLMLVLAIAAMSAVDLYLTLLYLTNVGMNEMNPLARAMIEYQSPGVLALWKCGTVVLCSGILLIIRKQRSAEIGAWVGCLVLGWLMSHWMVFIHETRDIDLQIVHEIARGDPTWVAMPGSGNGLGSGPIVID